MIISASRRTDIPAFYSSWLMNRIRAGYCLVPNPFNAKQISRVSLAQEDVDAFVFWSKNPEPMLNLLDGLTSRGFVYYFQYTLNDYPRTLEPKVPPVDRRIDTFHQLASRLGPRRVVWRYDPIIITPNTDYNFHATTFERLARLLTGATHRVVISVVDLYRKTNRRMNAHANAGFVIAPNAVSSHEMRRLLAHISHVAKTHGIEAFSCAEEHNFTDAGVRPGSCIDRDLIEALGGHVSSRKDTGQRPACRCVTSRDIGINDTCLHGCSYCYSTSNDELACQRHAQHDPASPVLLGHSEDPEPTRTKQLKLF